MGTAGEERAALGTGSVRPSPSHGGSWTRRRRTGGRLLCVRQPPVPPQGCRPGLASVRIFLWNPVPVAARLSTPPLW